MADELDLGAIEAREKAATEGPWEWERCYEMRHHHWALVNPQRRDGGVGDGHQRIVSVPLVLLSHSSTWFNEPFDQDPNLQFVAHARTDIPALLAEVRRLRGENERSEQERDDLRQVASKLMAELQDAHEAVVAVLPVGAPDSPPLKDRIAFIVQEREILARGFEALMDVFEVEKTAFGYAVRNSSGEWTDQPHPKAVREALALIGEGR